MRLELFVLAGAWMISLSFSVYLFCAGPFICNCIVLHRATIGQNETTFTYLLDLQRDIGSICGQDTITVGQHDASRWSETTRHECVITSGSLVLNIPDQTSRIVSMLVAGTIFFIVGMFLFVLFVIKLENEARNRRKKEQVR